MSQIIITKSAQPDASRKGESVMKVLQSIAGIAAHVKQKQN